MGAKRWVNLYFFQLQPSELIKLTLVLVLARYFHDFKERTLRVYHFVIPALLILLPTLLILRQPDLGTAMILLLVGGGVCFVVGMQWRLILSLALGALGGMPFLWRYLKPYQKNRILIFLNPEQDVLGTGYHALQSKIAIGSGGFFGKGLGLGTQSHLNFLPEKHTDFIFTVLAEETGFLGAITLLSLYGVMLYYGYRLALESRSVFSRLLIFGVMMMFFWHVFINVGMVTGFLPIVGVPLPLMSYGGTSLLTFMIAFSFVHAAANQSETRLPVA
jgi:rod shape determining protein RodA